MILRTTLIENCMVASSVESKDKCKEEHGGFICSRRLGHSGLHHAHGAATPHSGGHGCLRRWGTENDSEETEGLKQRIEKLKHEMVGTESVKYQMGIYNEALDEALTELSKTIEVMENKLQKMKKIGQACKDKDKKVYILGRCYQISLTLKALDSKEAKT